MGENEGLTLRRPLPVRRSSVSHTRFSAVLHPSSYSRDLEKLKSRRLRPARRRSLTEIRDLHVRGVVQEKILRSETIRSFLSSRNERLTSGLDEPAEKARRVEGRTNKAETHHHVSMTIINTRDDLLEEWTSFCFC